MFVLQELGDACRIRVNYDDEPADYFDSLAAYQRWLDARSGDAPAITSVTMHTTVAHEVLEDVLLGFYKLNGIPGATMQYNGAVLIVDVTNPATLGDAYNLALQVTTPIYDEDDRKDADELVAAGRAAADEPEAQGLR